MHSKSIVALQPEHRLYDVQHSRLRIVSDPKVGVLSASTDRAPHRCQSIVNAVYSAGAREKQ